MSENLTFEKSLAELENIVAKLEKEDCSLGEAIQLFEKEHSLIMNQNALFLVYVHNIFFLLHMYK